MFFDSFIFVVVVFLVVCGARNKKFFVFSPSIMINRMSMKKEDVLTSMNSLIENKCAFQRQPLLFRAAKSFIDAK